jgi:hypothetical protein
LRTARAHYADHKEWNEGLEGSLRDEWDRLYPGTPWHDAKGQVRRGWDAGK